VVRCPGGQASRYAVAAESTADPVAAADSPAAWAYEWWSFPGADYPRLLRIKERYDPSNLSKVHHGVGSDR